MPYLVALFVFDGAIFEHVGLRLAALAAALLPPPTGCLASAAAQVRSGRDAGTSRVASRKRRDEHDKSGQIALGTRRRARFEHCAVRHLAAVLGMINAEAIEANPSLGCSARERRVVARHCSYKRVAQLAQRKKVATEKLT